MAKITPIIAGNWKMHGLGSSVDQIDALGDLLARGRPKNIEILICPPFTLISRLEEAAGVAAIALGGQDCHLAGSGAHTGDISAEMLADAGVNYVIVGHSERRADHSEDNALVLAKARAVHRAGLMAIICVGESEAERDEGATLELVKKQLSNSLPEGATAENTVVAYEPVWAIGTGRTPTANDVAQVHGCIRHALEARFGKNGAGFRILYGGSVKPENAKELMGVANVNGALVGGASLKATDFYGIISAYL